MVRDFFSLPAMRVALIEYFRKTIQEDNSGIRSSQRGATWIGKTMGFAKNVYYINEPLTFRFLKKTGYEAALSGYFNCEGFTADDRRSQDLPPAYVLNGAMYLDTPAYLREDYTFFDDDACPLIIDNPVEELDIDTAHDFMIAKCIAAGSIDPTAL